ncbi:hypothetical protein RHMOL_Rhmol13G0191300 [Rhododendron molle]|uniref:Uncharacterized protein n=1 Tax=Rhododendron molle TaxID=49168 RepID=A0ACC0L996_RHOML|nr:hypothetical protein RHMOL_Rhmol13G0191300 [Rhododendron molle]
MVVRNCYGAFVAGRSMNLGVADSALCAESLARRAAFDFASLLGLEAIPIEGGSHNNWLNF